MNSTRGLFLFCGLIFFFAISTAYLLKDEFLILVEPEILRIFNAPASSSAKIKKMVPNLSPRQRELLEFSNTLFSKIPENLQRRVKKIELVDLSLPSETRADLEQSLRSIDLSLIESGDVILLIEALEQDGSIYLMCSMELIKSKNRIFEISDQLQKKTR